MREAPGVNGVPSQFEDLLSEVPHQCLQLDAIIVIVYYCFAGTRITTHIQLPVMRDEHQGLSTMPISKLGDRPGLVLCTHTNTHTYLHIFTSWRKGIPD
jgi:hypothetical protein